MYGAIKCILVVTAIGLLGFVYVSYSRRVARQDETLQPDFALPDLRQRDFDIAIKILTLNQDDEEALGDIRRLTLTDPPFPPAHRFFVNRLIQSGEYRESIEGMKKVAGHLEILSETGDIQAKLALAQICIVSNQHNQAIELLREVVGKQPGVNLLLARLLILQGQIDEATAVAEESVAHYTNKLATDPDDPTVPVALADAFGILDRNVEAAAALTKCAKDFPESREQITGHVIRHVDALLRRGDSEHKVIEILRQTIQYHPESLAVWSRVFQLSLDAGETGRIANDLVRDASKHGGSAGMLELVRGTHRFSMGNIRSAISDLENAYELSPDRPEVINNLAWYLAHDDPPQSKRAIDLADRLINDYPKQFEFRETRGQILALLGRDDEAIDDLQQALKVMPTYQPLIDTLASLYVKQGNEIKAIVLREKSAATAARAAKSRDVTTYDMLQEILRETPALDERTMNFILR